MGNTYTELERAPLYVMYAGSNQRPVMEDIMRCARAPRGFGWLCYVKVRECLSSRIAGVGRFDGRVLRDSFRSSCAQVLVIQSRTFVVFEGGETRMPSRYRERPSATGLEKSIICLDVLPTRALLLCLRFFHAGFMP